MNAERLKEALRALEGRHVLVVGDLMLDEYVWGEVTRISPDAPVQVVDIRARSMIAGGAANVAANIAAAGGRPVLVGVLGDDAPGRELAALVRGAGVGEAGLLVEKGRPTTVKTRVVARGQHVVRLDHEVRTPLAPGTRNRLVRILGDLLPACEAVLVSDYAKGVVDGSLVAGIASLLAGAGKNVPIVVDPKAVDVSMYRGCTAITPNLREAETAARMAIGDGGEIEKAARRIREACGAALVLITRGDKGIALARADGAPALVSARRARSTT